MRQIIFCAASALAFASALAAYPARAQSPELPQPSPKARVEQRVGLTDFVVEYSSPGVKGRKIWGELVPLDKPWRTGANAATKLKATTDFVFGGKSLPAGTYALYTIPTKTSWTVALNSSAEQWGVYGLDPKLDVTRVTVNPVATPARERLTFLFSDSTDDATRLDLEWEKLRVSVPIRVDTKKLVDAGIDKATGDAWRPHFVSARWMLESGGDLDKALGYIDASVALKANWSNNWVRASILAKKGRAADAVAAAEKARELGKGDKVFEDFFKGDVEKAIAEWKRKP